MWRAGTAVSVTPGAMTSVCHQRKLAGAGDSVAGEKGGVAESRVDRGLPRRLEPRERGQVHVVVMIVADEHDVDRGRSSKRIPGGRCRRAPTNGADRSDHVGSVSTLMPSVWTRNVEWLTKVTRSPPVSMHAAGRGPGGVSVKERHGPRDAVVLRRSQSRNPVTSGSGW